ncbi:MAG: polysaccharide deacetylase family protein, partial [Candidatus Omnitrophica bacterium]|nr:polysaccharide deacetylase family protein [Candidatus Omnitrophota bacterium]
MKYKTLNYRQKYGGKKAKAFCPRIIAGLLLVIIFLFYAYLYSHHTTPILMYHSFDSSRTNEYAAVTPDNFYKQMRFIKENKYKVMSLDDYCRLLKNKKPIPRNSVVLTIDDGYKDNLEAVKILKNFDFPATLFLTVNRIGKPDFLSETDIKSIIKETKIKIGSHTMTHPDLWKLQDAQLKDEILGSRYSLERRFKAKIDTLSYPGGGYDGRAVKEVENAGYLCACTTNRGVSKKINLFSLRRIKATNNDTNFSLWSK